MSSLLTCPQGHRWDRVRIGSGLGAADPVRCPVCGAAGEPLPEEEATAHGDECSTTMPPRGEAPRIIAPYAGSIPGYELLGELGRGGMGVVYKARQPKLNRMVAVKLILAGSQAGPQDLARFRTEAEAAARLQHPNVVQIFEIGEHEGRDGGGPVPYMVMEFVGGGTLAQRFGGRPLAPAHAARLVHTLALAVDAAHRQGIVHRDLKPSNILLAQTEDRGSKIEDRRSKIVDRPAAPLNLRSSILDPRSSILCPKIADFGLAKQLGREGPTQTDTIMGTPSYMAPEQTSSRPGDIGPAVDIYALGAILYELLTGQPPFRGESKMDTLMQVRTLDPVPPSRLQPGVPRDLEIICLHCLRKEPHRRYPSALAFVEDLQSFLEGRSILARPPGTLERVARWASRHRAAAALLLVVGLVVAVGFPGVTGLWLAARQARATAQAEAQHAEQARDEANALRLQAERREARLALERGLSLCEQGEVGGGLTWLAHSLQRTTKLGDTDLEQAIRVNLADWATQFCVPGIRLQHLGEVHRAAFSPDGKTVLVGAGKLAHQYDAATGQPAGPPLTSVGPPRIVWSVACTPDGQAALLGREDGTAELLDAQTGRLILRLAHGTDDVWSVAVSPNGKTLLTAGDGSVRLWDRTTGQSVGQPLEHPRLPGEAALPFHMVIAVAVSPDGKAVLTGSRDHTARLWDAATGQPVGPPLPHTDWVRSVAFSPDGRTLLTGSRDGTAQLWDAETGKPLGEPLRHTHEIEMATFSPDGQLVLTGGRDDAARLWNAATRQPLGPPLPHDGGVGAVAFSPDGSTLLIGGLDGTLRCWRAPRSKALGRPLPHTDVVQSVAFLGPDGRRLGTASPRSVCAWDATTGVLLGKMDTEPRVRSVAYPPDGKTIATGSWHRDVLLWDVPTEPGPSHPPQSHAFALGGGARLAAFTPDGHRLLTVGEMTERQVRVWDVATRRLLEPTFTHETPVVCLTVSPDGLRLATGCRDHTVRLWDTETGVAVGIPLLHPESVKAVAFSPDVKTLTTGCQDGGVRLWEVGTSQLREPSPRHQGPVLAVAFSPDGKRLVTGGGDRAARIWDATTGVALGPSLWHADAVQAVAWSPDGQQILTGGRDRTAQRWQVPPPALGGRVEQIALWVEALTGLELDVSGNARRLEGGALVERRRRLTDPDNAAFAQTVPLP
jgi:WD40 repeat protein/serine/threonine protein kinase